tara:strand:+ start:1647 stop:2393 length:747 start_codon:yes stop_codon:yes gene_type:complete
LANTIDAIIQARLGSTRLPGKVLLKINGRTILDHCIDRIKEVSSINKIIVATTINSVDDRIEEFCNKKGLLCFRGSEKNVIKRFIGSCRKFQTDRFLRICSDNPFIDSKLMEDQISAIESDDDYCSYYTESGQNAIVMPVGFFVEAVTRRALEKAYQLGSHDPRTKEHVTYYIHSNPKDFKIKKLRMPSYINPELRFTIDYHEDFSVAKFILKRISKPNAKNITKLVRNDEILRQMIYEITVAKPKKY